MTRFGSQALITDSKEEQERYEDLFSILTPIVKNYMAVKGQAVCVHAMQVFGGAGYTKDYLWATPSWPGCCCGGRPSHLKELRQAQEKSEYRLINKL